MIERKEVLTSNFDDLFDYGAVVYGRWLGRTLDINGWSHPSLIRLGKRIVGKDKSYIHSSQISALRTGSLKSPGPRSFASLVLLFHSIDEFQRGVLSPDGPDFSGVEHLIENAVIMRDDKGKPADIGYHFEVFCGWRLPPESESSLEITQAGAEMISKNAGKYVRSLFAAERKDLIDDLPGYLPAFSKDKTQQKNFSDVVLSQGYWGPDDIDDAMRLLATFLKTKFKVKLKSEELRKQFSA